MSLDGIPYIGEYSKVAPNIYVATGFNKWGMTGSMVSAQIISAMICGEQKDYAPVFSPSRSILHPQLLINGMEQRKIQMLARENLPRIGKEAPVCIHTPLIHGLDGDDKMSSSKGNYIAVDDDEKTIKDKIKKSYCPMGETEGNPILEIADHFVFSQQDTLLIERPEKFGGNLELTKEELYTMYGEENLHPMDLKNAITQYLIDFLKPVRDFMESQE